MKPFSQWTVEEIEEEFQLTLQPHYHGLRAWLDGASLPTEAETESLRQLAAKLALHIRDWNEEELKVYFIALLLDKVNFYSESYRPFMEREIAVEYAAGKKLWGVIDFLVAQGKHSPKEPFFFIHEYKKQFDTSNDPLGQLLAEMVAAQTINRRLHPIYGAYIVGRHWYFVILEGQVYSESLAYDATKEEILAIFAILCHTKALIHQLSLLEASPSLKLT